jgi:molybdenum cofactor synthesis domain-containing protein
MRNLAEPSGGLPAPLAAARKLDSLAQGAENDIMIPLTSRVRSMMQGSAIITLSDSASRGEREDLSGRTLKELLEKHGFLVILSAILPDEFDLLKEKLVEFCDDSRLSLVLTTGGTGLSPRDITPEATRSVIEREVPGLAELIRSTGQKYSPHSSLSRGVAGIRKQTLIINLPGSAKAVQQSMETLLPILPHALEILSGQKVRCGT